MELRTFPKYNLNGLLGNLNFTSNYDWVKKKSYQLGKGLCGVYSTVPVFWDFTVSDLQKPIGLICLQKQWYAVATTKQFWKSILRKSIHWLHSKISFKLILEQIQLMRSVVELWGYHKFQTISLGHEWAWRSCCWLSDLQWCYRWSVLDKQYRWESFLENW